MPANTVVNGPEAYVPLPALTGVVDVNAGAVTHVASLGPNMVNVIVPVGDTPDRVALSEMMPPAATGADAAVVIAGDAFETTTLSAGSAQAPDTAALLPSPL